jgi:hypothetical protein
MSDDQPKVVNIVEVKSLRPMLQKFNEDLGQYINDDQRYKLGRVLTIIDASFSDPEQRKAVKDLVQSEWWSHSRVPSDTPMASPHTDLRAISKALGFELYIESDHAVPISMGEHEYTEMRALERYQQAAELANKSK